MSSILLIIPYLLSQVMLKDPKLQDMMSAVMGGGPEAMKKYLGDPAALMLLQKLTTAISRVTNK